MRVIDSVDLFLTPQCDLRAQSELACSGTVTDGVGTRSLQCLLNSISRSVSRNKSVVRYCVRAAEIVSGDSDQFLAALDICK
jgi:hypothetical protein